MKTITLRKQPEGCAMILLWILYAAFLGVYICIVKICLDPAQSGGAEPYFGYIILGIVTLMIPVPVIVSIVNRYRDAHIKYVLSESEMLCYYGEKVIKRVSRDDIHLFGCFTTGRNAWIFFCTASDEEISGIADEHWGNRYWIYNKHQVEELEKTSSGVWQMKMALYLHFAVKSRDQNVMTVEFQKQAHIQEISALWSMEPFLVGSYAIEHSDYYSGKGQF